MYFSASRSWIKRWIAGGFTELSCHKDYVTLPWLHSKWSASVGPTNSVDLFQQKREWPPTISHSVRHTVYDTERQIILWFPKPAYHYSDVNKQCNELPYLHLTWENNQTLHEPLSKETTTPRFGVSFTTLSYSHLQKGVPLSTWVIGYGPFDSCRLKFKLICMLEAGSHTIKLSLLKSAKHTKINKYHPV